MRDVELTWGQWRAVIAALRAKALPYMRRTRSEHHGWYAPAEDTEAARVVPGAF